MIVLSVAEATAQAIFLANPVRSEIKQLFNLKEMMCDLQLICDTLHAEYPLEFSTIQLDFRLVTEDSETEYRGYIDYV